MNAIGLAIVDMNGNRYLYKTPRFAKLEEGDEVILVEADYGESRGIVVTALDWVEDDSETYDFVLKAMRAEEPLGKIVGVLKLKEFEYEEDEILKILAEEVKDDGRSVKGIIPEEV